MDDLVGEVTNFDYIRMLYSAPKIITEFELEASAGITSCQDGEICQDNIFNPWELP